jgi:hypothetical protein
VRFFSWVPSLLRRAAGGYGSWVFWSVDMSGLYAHAPEVKGSSWHEYAHCS